MRTSHISTLAFALLVGCAPGEGTTDQQSGGDDTVGGDCTFTQGYWKNHEAAWPVSSLSLGGVTYSQEELLAIFDEPVRGNGLVSLAHQLIAAKLNIAFGADDGDIADEIAAADGLIDLRVVPPIGSGYLAPNASGSLADALDVFNNSSGDTCGGDEPTCGDGDLDAGEACDDGNTTSGDGCSATCEVEKAPCCGDGVMDAGEACDDGNTTSGDGCSSTCEIEPPCGNGKLDPGEECDDGNTTDGDGCSSACLCEPYGHYDRT